MRDQHPPERADNRISMEIGFMRQTDKRKYGLNNIVAGFIRGRSQMM